MKKILIIGNWKLNGNKNTIINTLTTLITNISNNTFKYIEIAIAPPILYLDTVNNYLSNSNIKLCAQNVDMNLSGAFTGEISASMLKDIGVEYVLIGHSERRQYHQENNSHIAKKLSILKKIGITPILCIGENKIEHDSESTELVCTNQINSIIELIGIQSFKNTIIAYEPIWAIGSGISASPNYAQLTHKFIRNYIKKYDKNIAKQTSILYGGSVNLNNAIQFIDQKDINGVLIGSASLNIDNFLKIIQSITKNIEGKSNF